MPLNLYNRNLVESWGAVVRKPSKPHPALEAESDEQVDRSEDISGGIGDYGRIVDYEGEDEMGYSEPSADSSLDSDTARLGMNVVDGTAEETDTGIDEPQSKADRSLYLARLNYERRDLLRNTLKIAGDILEKYREFSGERGETPEAVQKGMDALAEAMAREPNESPSDEMNPARVAQHVWWCMESLGIAAHDNDFVPPGLPDGVLTQDTLVSLFYLTMHYRRAMKDFYSGGTFFGIDLRDKDAVRLAAGIINSHIAGKTGGEPRLTPYRGNDGEGDRALYYTNAVRKSDRQYNDTRSVTAGSTQVKSSGGFSKNINIRYMGTTYPRVTRGSVFAIPHKLFTDIIDALEMRNSTGSRKVTRAGIDAIKKLGYSVEDLAAELAFIGVARFSEKYGVAAHAVYSSPGRMTSGSSYIQFPNTEEGKFRATQAVIYNLKEIIEKAVKTASTLNLDGKSADKSLLTTVLNDMSKAKSKTRGVYEFVSPALYRLGVENATYKTPPRRMMVNGSLKLMPGSDEPLFDFFIDNYSETNTTMTGVDRDGEEIGAGREYLSNETKDMADVDSGSVMHDVHDTRVDTLLDTGSYRTMCTMFGFTTDSIPRSQSSEKEKVRFIKDMLLRISDGFTTLGSTSRLVTGPDGKIVEEISSEDSDVSGDSIVHVWRDFIRRYSEEHPGVTAVGMKGDTQHDVNARAVLRSCSLSPTHKGYGMWRFLKTSLAWLNTYSVFGMNNDELKVGLCGSMEEFEHAKRCLNPYINEFDFVKALIESDVLRHGAGERCSAKEAFDFIKRVVSGVMKDNRVDVFSPGAIEDVFDGIRMIYGDDREEMLRKASVTPSENPDELLPWCVLRFAMSGISYSEPGHLIPPEDVASGAGNVDPLTQRLIAKYDAVLAKKPSFMKASAWLARNGLNMNDYEYLKSESRGDVRAIDMSPGEISGWLSDEYLHKGDPREMFMLVLGLIYVVLRRRDEDIADSQKTSSEQSVTALTAKNQSLVEFLVIYGAERVVSLVGAISQDGGAAFSDLVYILGTDVPFGEEIPGQPEETERRNEIIERFDEIYNVVTSYEFLLFPSVE